MNMTEIQESLLDQNPWWKGPFKTAFRHRDIHAEIQKYLALPQILAFTGLRRVGKTTLMLKIAEDAIQAGLDAKNVVYFSFDEFKGTELRRLVSEYEDLMERDFRNGKYLLLLDEIQKLENWENQLKGIYDTFGKSIKIIVSGSESLFIRRKSKETLAGRIFSFKVQPLSFREFLSFRGASMKPQGLYQKELSRLLDEYLLTLGFPELLNVKDKEIIRKYIKEAIVEKVIFRDMQQLFKIRDISLIESLLNIFMDEPGQLTALPDLSKELGVSRQTLSSYLTYLEESFLIRKSYNYSRNRRKTERKLKKYYPAIISAELLFREDDISKGKVFEWLIVTQLSAEYFWRDPYKNEVDMVLAGDKPMPVEIKYGKTDFKGVLAFMKKFKVDEGMIITKNLEQKHAIDGKKISVMPAFKFLLREQLPANTTQTRQ
ncbi:ATP-binding protein [Candidatus Woesearchaeota archaeon]|nr:ATP-binding protein [Candidatus Woesearchaeota archaeon]